MTLGKEMMLYSASLTSESVAETVIHSVACLWGIGYTPTELKLEAEIIKEISFIETEVVVLCVYIGGKMPQQ